MQETLESGWFSLWGGVEGGFSRPESAPGTRDEQNVGVETVPDFCQTAKTGVETRLSQQLPKSGVES